MTSPRRPRPVHEMTPIEPRLQAALAAAMSQIKATATSAAQRVSESFGVQAQSSSRISERDLLNAVQFDLRRNMNTFHQVFGDELRAKVAAEVSPQPDPARKLEAANWQTLSLVDDSEMEERMFSDRIGQLISHASEVELRELAAYMGSLLNTGRADQDRNPLRAEVLGAALYRAIEAVSDLADARKLLARELGQGMARDMPGCYTRIVADLHSRGVRPVMLTVRTVEGPGNLLPGGTSGYASLSSLRSQHGEFDAASSGAGGAGGDVPGGPGSRHGGGATSGHGAGAGSGGSGGTRSPAQRSGPANSEADLQLMALLRRLTAIASRPGELDTVPRGPPGSGYGGGGNSRAGRSSGAGLFANPAEPAGALAGPSYVGNGHAGLMAVNLIRAHREELLQASTGKLDHMVIDVVGSLFDQI